MKKKMLTIIVGLMLAGTTFACDYTQATGGGWSVTVAPSGTWELDIYTCATCQGPTQNATRCSSSTASPTSVIRDIDPNTGGKTIEASCCSCTDYSTVDCSGSGG